MNIKEASLLAECYKTWLSPWCDRIEIAGSIRRRKEEVKDIELVCIPKLVQSGMFDDIASVHPQFISSVNRLQKIKGEPTGKYTQRRLPEGINLDLFIANVENWGLIYAIRTGSATYSHEVLAKSWVKRGFKSENGYLVKGGAVIPVREEEDLFHLIGLPWVPPEQRNYSHVVALDELNTILNGGRIA